MPRTSASRCLIFALSAAGAVFFTGPALSQGVETPGEQTPETDPLVSEAVMSEATDADDGEAVGELRGVGRSSDRLKLEVAARAAYFGSAGAIEIDGSRRIPAEFLNTEAPRLRPAWRVGARKGRYGLDVWGQSTRTVGRTPFALAQTPQAGFRITPSRNEVQLDTVDFRLSRVWHERAYDPAGTGTPAIGVLVEPFVGLRLVDFRSSIEQTGPPFDGGADPGPLFIEESVTTLEPNVGLRGAMTFYDRVTMDLSLAIGARPDLGDGINSSSGNLEYAFRFHLSRSVDVEAGYRLLIQDVEDEGKLLLDGSTAGLFLGVIYRF